MSLFKARDWWSTVSGYEEFYSNGSLTIAPVTPETETTKNVIMVGSFSGILRAYSPSHGSFSPDHLLLETQLSQPIINLGMAKIKSTLSPFLIVLHPRLLVFYSLALSSGQLGLTAVSQHSLSHTSHSMIIGRFGKTNDQLVCVQSLDGRLTFFDFSGEVLHYNLPNFLLPGPLVYIFRTDTFLVASSGWSLEAYRYQTLCSGSKVKKSKCDWSLPLNEPVIDIKVITTDSGPWYVMVLGERNLYCIEDLGALQFSKKLESISTCVLPYKFVDSPTPTINYMLAGHSQQLQIFSNQIMIWSAQLSHVPVSLSVEKFDDLDGLIVTLDEVGHVQCSYLGTDPTSFAQSLVPNHTVSTVKELEEELKGFQTTINDLQDSGVLEVVQEEVLFKVVSVNYSEPRPLENDDGDNVHRRCVEAKVQIECSIDNVDVYVDLAPPLSAHPLNFSCESGIQDVDLTFVCSGDLLTFQNEAHLVVTYSKGQDHTHRIDHTLFLPLGLFCTPTQPQDGQHKITLDSTHNCVPMSFLYPSSRVERVRDDTGPSNAVAFETLNGDIVTMISSKTTNRYRLQCDSFPSMYLFTKDLVTRLSQHFVKTEGFSLSVPGLPLPEYFDTIEQHHNTRLALQQCLELLGRHAHQFRAIQKRLLARFKDKTPAGLAHLDTLLDGTFMQLMALTEKCEELKSEEDKATRQLNCVSNLVILLLSLLPHLKKDDVDILRSVLLCNVTSDQGWEELVDVGVTHLLRSNLAKSQKEEAVALPDLTPLTDCKRLKRHLALLCDRLVKGGRLVSPTATRSLVKEGVVTQNLSTLMEESEN